MKTKTKTKLTIKQASTRWSDKCLDIPSYSTEPEGCACMEHEWYPTHDRTRHLLVVTSAKYSHAQTTPDTHHRANITDQYSLAHSSQHIHTSNFSLRPHLSSSSLINRILCCILQAPLPDQTYLLPCGLYSYASIITTSSPHAAITPYHRTTIQNNKWLRLVRLRDGSDYFTTLA